MRFQDFFFFLFATSLRIHFWFVFFFLTLSLHNFNPIFHSITIWLPRDLSCFSYIDISLHPIRPFTVPSRRHDTSQVLCCCADSLYASSSNLGKDTVVDYGVSFYAAVPGSFLCRFPRFSSPNLGRPVWFPSPEVWFLLSSLRCFPTLHRVRNFDLNDFAFLIFSFVSPNFLLRFSRLPSETTDKPRPSEHSFFPFTLSDSLFGFFFFWYSPVTPLVILRIFFLGALAKKVPCWSLPFYRLVLLPPYDR